jgi:hypothetical protein
MNLATQIGVRTVRTAALAWSAANLLPVPPVTHPPQENPITIDATAPITIPCRRRVSDSPKKIDGTRITFVPSIKARRTGSRWRLDLHIRRSILLISLFINGLKLRRLSKTAHFGGKSKAGIFGKSRFSKLE